VPAIQPARLRHQAALLTQHFHEPEAFIRGLHYLFDFYADRTQHPGLSSRPSPLIDAYNVRPQVLRLIILEISPLVIEDPEQGLVLCDTLWKEPFLEFKSMGAILLGQIPPNPAQRITDQAKTWIAPDLEEYTLGLILDHGLARIRLENPQMLIQLIQTWLEDSDPFYRIIGLRTLLTLIEHPKYENLPVAYGLLQSFARSAPSVLRADLLDVLAALARRSPQETAYFLRQTLSTPGAEDTAWLIRQILSEFPPEIRENLRMTLKKLPKEIPA